MIASLYTMTTKHGGPPERWGWGPGGSFRTSSWRTRREHRQLTEQAARLRDFAELLLPPRGLAGWATRRAMDEP